MSTDVPVTIWIPTEGNIEYSTTSASALVDTAGVAVVDTAAVAVVDTGVVETPEPATLWAEHDDE